MQRRHRTTASRSRTQPAPAQPALVVVQLAVVKLVLAALLLTPAGCAPQPGAALQPSGIAERLQVPLQAISSRLQARAQPKPEPCLAGYRCQLGAAAGPGGAAVSEVHIRKGTHRLYLIAGDTVIRRYRVAIGRGGAGPKLMEGDGKTPVGRYRITSRLPKSPWHLFLGVSYPNVDDQKRHREGKRTRAVPWDRGIGFGIGIHGRRKEMRDGAHKLIDWTLGCIALDNDEIEEVARLVPNGTSVVIEE